MYRRDVPAPFAQIDATAWLRCLLLPTSQGYLGSLFLLSTWKEGKEGKGGRKDGRKEGKKGAAAETSFSNLARYVDVIM